MFAVLLQPSGDFRRVHGTAQRSVPQSHRVRLGQLRALLRVRNSFLEVQRLQPIVLDERRRIVVDF